MAANPLAWMAVKRSLEVAPMIDDKGLRPPDDGHR